MLRLGLGFSVQRLNSKSLGLTIHFKGWTLEWKGYSLDRLQVLWYIASTGIRVYSQGKLSNTWIHKVIMSCLGRSSKGQHSAPRGGPPRSWTNDDLTKALDNVWNKRMTTKQASRVFEIPYNSLLMYVRGKYGKSLRLDVLKMKSLADVDFNTIGNSRSTRPKEKPMGPPEFKTNQKKKTCQICEKVLNSKSFSRHMRDLHGQSPQVNPVNKVRTWSQSDKGWVKDGVAAVLPL